MSKQNTAIDRFEQILKFEYGASINNLKLSDKSELADLAWNLYKELSRLQQESINNIQILKNVVRKLLELYGKQFTNLEFDKICQNDEQTFKIIKNRLGNTFQRVLNIQPKVIQFNAKFNAPQAQNQSNFINQEQQRLQEQYDLLFKDYQNILKRNFGFYEKHKKLVDCQTELINQLKKDKDDIRKQLFEQQRIIFDLQNTQKHTPIVNYPEQHKQEFENFNKEFENLQKKTQDIMIEQDKIKKKINKNNEQEIEEEVHILMAKIKQVSANNQTVLNRLTNLKPLINQQQDNLMDDFDKKLKFLQMNVSIYDSISKALSKLLNWQAQLKENCQNLQNINEKFKTILDQQGRKIQLYMTSYSNNSQKEGIQIRISTYFKCFKEFITFALSSIQLIPSFIDQRQHLLNLIQNLQLNNTNQNINIDQIRSQINTSIILFSDLANFVQQRNDATLVLSSSIIFLKTYVSIVNPITNQEIQLQV